MAAPAELKIVLLGKTGSGKSSAGNVILGKEKFEVYSDPISVTIDCPTEEGSINGWKFAVTDTPGIFDTDQNRSEKDLKYSIISCLTECAPGPHAFILVLRVGRYTKEEKESVRKILKWFGEEALKHTVVLFTHGDELDKNQTTEEYVKKNKDLKELIDKCGGRVHVIDSKQWNRKDDKNAADILEQLKKMVIKREPGESLTLEEIKNMLLEPKSSTPDQEPGQGSGRPSSSDGNLDGSEYRSNSFQVKQLLTTINNMVTNNRSGHYINKSLQIIAEAIEMEVKKIKEMMEKRGKKAEESEIRRLARERVRTKTLRLVAGVTTGALLGALLGVAVGLSLPAILAAGFLAGAATTLYGKLEAKSEGAACSSAVVAGVLGGGAGEGVAAGALAAAGAASAEAGAVGALGAAGAPAGIGVGVAAGVLGTGAAMAEVGILVAAASAEAGALGAAVAEAGTLGALVATGAVVGEGVAAGALGAGAAMAEVGTLVAAGAAEAGAAGAASAEAGAVGALGAAGAAAGIGVGVAAGVFATAGAIGGGIEGAKAAARADKPKEAVGKASEAVVEKAGNMVKKAWEAGQRVTKAKETPYKKL